MLWKPLVPIVLLLCLAAAGCSDENPVIETPSPLDDQVIANCFALQAAAEAYADDHDGEYPNSAPSGYVNPYTDLTTRWPPSIALYPGETGYLPIRLAYGGAWRGYLITGFGRDGEVIGLSNVPRGVFHLEEQVVANCLIVQDAVEAFAADNEWEYPDDTNSDTNLLGKTVIDYLPGGIRLKNPYTGNRDVPLSAAAAANPGEIGYQTVINSESSNIGYAITGFGRDALLVTIIPGAYWKDWDARGRAYRLRDLVRAFAADNNGIYPNDIDADTTLSGDTIMDMIGDRWENIYTEELTEPRNGLATERGQVGYVPVSRHTHNDGYIVNAWGLFDENIRFEK